MSKENYPNEVVVRDSEYDEPYFLPEDEAKRQEQQGKVVIQKNDNKQSGTKQA